MVLLGLYSLLTVTPAVTALLAAPATGSVYFTTAIKMAPRPHLVINLVSVPPAEASLDGISQLIDGEIQFDGYAESQQAARALTKAVRDFLMTTYNKGTLPDGTTIQFVDVSMDHDEPEEQGGTGYLFRSLLRLKAFYTEP